MKHILNNLSEEEKNAIREQHSGGMKIELGKFKQMVETKLGDPKPYLDNEKKQISEGEFDAMKSMVSTITLSELKDCLKMNSLVLSALPFHLIQGIGKEVKDAVMKLEKGVATDDDAITICYGLIGVAEFVAGEPEGKGLAGTMGCLNDKMQKKEKSKYGL